jgi:copper chaperone
MALKKLEIAGMSCGHCVKGVTMALQDLPGVQVKDVSIGAAVVDVDESVVSESQLSQALEEAGYSIEKTSAA